MTNLSGDLEENKDDGELKIITVQVVVGGKVQGVSFRSSLKNLADGLSVTGWTRNLPDGTVEALLQGDETQVRKVIDWCHTGPRSARVDSVKESSLYEKKIYRNFMVHS